MAIPLFLDVLARKAGLIILTRALYHNKLDL